MKIIKTAILTLLALPLFAIAQVPNEVEVSFTVVVDSASPTGVVAFLDSRNIGNSEDIPEVRLAAWAHEVVSKRLAEEADVFISSERERITKEIMLQATNAVIVIRVD